jgi:hypothetical protein
MRFVADENFPRPALGALPHAGWEVFSVAEECPGISDEEVAALCSESQRVLLAFDKDFGNPVFRRGLSVGSGVVFVSAHSRISRRSRRSRFGTGELAARPQREFLCRHTGADSSPANATGPGSLNGPTPLANPHPSRREARQRRILIPEVREHFIQSRDLKDVPHRTRRVHDPQLSAAHSQHLRRGSQRP